MMEKEDKVSAGINRNIMEFKAIQRSLEEFDKSELIET